MNTVSTPKVVPNIQNRSLNSKSRGAVDTGFSSPEFLSRLKDRDPASVEAVVDAYLPQLLRTGRGMGFSSDAAEDLAQSTFLALLQGLERFEGRSHIRTFLFGIFYNKVGEYLREKLKAEASDPIDEVMESRFDERGRWRQPPADIERELLGQETRSSILDCLAALPKTQRIVFHLRAVQEEESEEICKKMTISKTNLGVILFRARNRMRECLEKKGFRKGQ